ncbi:MAG: polysaccharide deacetylase family protein [Muribaculaceae bacterium]|nr:polysaccharide deacetylase family protein [Muribaculaceae bacterium]
MRGFIIGAIVLLLVGTAVAPFVVCGASADHSITYDRCGATVAMPSPDNKSVYLIFTADSMFEGADFALTCLKEHNVKASFFFTGNFLRDSVRNSPVIKRVIREGHYVGPHSDRHILLADWDSCRSTLVSPDSAVTDIMANIDELSSYGVMPTDVSYIVPPYEWYNAVHIKAYRDAGFIPVNPSPGFLSYRDYTTPDMEDYFSSDSIWSNFLENIRNRDINGEFIILHLGTQDSRTDKFYYRLPEMIDSLVARGYHPARL